MVVRPRPAAVTMPNFSQEHLLEEPAAEHEEWPWPDDVKEEEGYEDQPLEEVLLELPQEPLEEDRESAKKRRKKETLEDQMLRKDAHEEELAEALARGEVPLPEPAPPALEEPPPLAPHLRALTTAALDPGVSSEQLVVMFNRFLALREEMVGFIAQPEELSVPTRRRTLLRMVEDRLRCMDGEAVPLAVLAADPAVVALRRGVAKSFLSFVQAYPESFQVSEELNPRGKMMQVIRLVGAGRPGTGIASLEGSVGAELLMKQVTVALQSRGGCALVSELAEDPAIKERSRGVATKLSKFLLQHDDLFQLVQDGENGELVCNLVNNVPVSGIFPSAPEAAYEENAHGMHGRKLLLQQVVASLEARGGAATISDLGKDHAIRDRARGVAAKLGKFLSSHPKVFSVAAEGDRGELVCRLLPGAEAAQWGAPAASPAASAQGGRAQDLPPPLAVGAHPADGIAALLRAGALGAATETEPEAAEEDPRQLLLQQIVTFLEEHGGSANLCVLGQDPAIRHLSKGVSKLSKFLAQHPELFMITLAGEPAVLTCQLIAPAET